MSKKKGLAILGATGYIGKQAIEIVDTYPDYFDLQVLTAYSNADLLIAQALKLQPNIVVIVDEAQYKKVSEALWAADIHVYAGKDALSQVLESGEVEIVLNAITGFAGIVPTIAAINAKKNVALANTESIVVAGELVTKLAQKHGVNIYPVGAQQSSIFQCLVGEFQNKIEKIFLCTQIGDLQNMNLKQLHEVTKETLIKDPISYGHAKRGVDSASMIHSGFSVIQARWMFNLKPNQMDILVQKKAFVNGLVQFEDGVMKSLVAFSDPSLPIQFALTYPERFKTNYARFNFLERPELTLEHPNPLLIQNVELSRYALKMGGTAACVLNAANDVAVDAFLSRKIGFSEIAKLNNDILRAAEVIKDPIYEDYLACDYATRQAAINLIS